MQPTTPQTTPDTNKTSGMSHLIVYGLMLIVGFALGAGVFYMYPLREKVVEKQVTVNPTVKLPPNLVQISGCVPHMGEHWAELNKLPSGPYYVINKGKLLGVEYMLRTKDIPGDIPAHMSQKDSMKFIQEHKLTFANLIDSIIPDHTDFVQGAQIKFWDIEWSPPHAGLVEPHYDLHFYLVDRQELNNICPDAAVGSELSPELATQLKKLGVPIPE